MDGEMVGIRQRRENSQKCRFLDDEKQRHDRYDPDGGSRGRRQRPAADYALFRGYFSGAGNGGFF